MKSPAIIGHWRALAVVANQACPGCGGLLCLPSFLAVQGACPEARAQPRAAISRRAGGSISAALGFAFQREGQIDYSLVIYTRNRQVFLTMQPQIPRVQGPWRLARVLLNTGHPHLSRITGATMNTAGAFLKKPFSH